MAWVTAAGEKFNNFNEAFDKSGGRITHEIVYLPAGKDRTPMEERHIEAGDKLVAKNHDGVWALHWEDRNGLLVAAMGPNYNSLHDAVAAGNRRFGVKVTRYV